MPFTWSSDLEMGISELDDLQKELFSRFEIFSEHNEDICSHEVFADLFDFLDQYTQKYLRYEELLLEKSFFPSREEHVEAHKHFVNDIVELKERISRGEKTKEAALSLKRLMIRWIIMHSKHMDKEFLDYLLQTVENNHSELVRKRLGDILQKTGLINNEALDQALEMQRNNGKALGNVLVEMGLIKTEEIIEAMAIQKGMLKI